ncbi:unnamed protein product [Pedinophyceae sp. YPF-701]|nr:unnamed protein product [Pedinophyceae sp. YPF-701]
MPASAAFTAAIAAKPVVRPTNARRSLQVSASAVPESTGRRAAIAGTGAALFAATAGPALAAYGEGANVFGKKTNVTGFLQYAGDGYSMLVPSKWNPSREKDNQYVVVRYEDNGDQANNLYVSVEPASKADMSEFGEPLKWLASNALILGQQSWVGDTVSEGGFARGATASASILDVSDEKDKKGRTVYRYHVLTRSADGDEGGRHILINAVVSNGKLYVQKLQVGDKRWFKGTDKFALGSWDSFTVA